MSQRNPQRSARSAVDWDQVRLRLKMLETSLTEHWEPGQEQKHSVLRQRAAALAAEPRTVAAPGEQLAVVEFLIGRDRYGIETAYVTEVVPLKELTTLPFAPDHWLGITNVRGQVILVLDIRKFLHLPGRGLSESSKVLLVGSGAAEIGIVTDIVVNVRGIDLRDLQPSRAIAGSHGEHLRGITSDNLALLDVTRILAATRMQSNAGSRSIAS